MVEDVAVFLVVDADMDIDKVSDDKVSEKPVSALGT